jgi:hypothetical protein
MLCAVPCCAHHPHPQVRRFVKFNLGEGLEKKSNDFAAEVAQQTQKKDAAPAKPAAAKEQPKQQVSWLRAHACRASFDRPCLLLVLVGHEM